MSGDVDLFADVAAAVLARLYMSFPIPLDVEVDAIAEDALRNGEPDGATAETFVEASPHWLRSAGLLVLEPGQLGARLIERVGLKARGFLALNAPDPDGTPIGRVLLSRPSPDLRRSFVEQALAASR